MPYRLAIAAVLVACGLAPAPAQDHWPQWRGPLATGAAAGADPPLTWSETENVRWKVELPGTGHSSPIVSGDRIYLTTAVAHGDAVDAGADHVHDDGAHDNVTPRRKMKFIVMAVNRKDGSIAWSTTVRDERPHEATHTTGTWASNSPVTDGKNLYVSFGSRGIYCLDMQGKLVWERDLGEMLTRHNHGEGSSPALHGDTLVVNWDHEGDSFLYALDARSGKTRWKVARDEMTSWSTPLIVEHDGKAQIVIAATGKVRGYDLKSGTVIWECAGLSRNVVASPVAADGIVYVANSYNWKAMMAIRLADAKGDITGTDAVIWSRNRDTPYVPSPVLHDGTLCFVKHLQPLLTCVDAASGKTRAPIRRLSGLDMIFASPVVAGGRIYIPSRNGATAVVRLGGEYETLALNRLDDTFSASPAVVGKELYLRGEGSLYRISAPIARNETDGP